MIHFVIPAYNESQNLPTLLEKISSCMQEYGLNYSVLIIDDGSSDDTNAVIENLSARYPLKSIRHIDNRGAGQAFLTGFQEILKCAKNDDIIITKEADNTSDLSIIKNMIDKINGGSDLVLASCYADGGGIEGTNPLRIFISSSANLLLRLFFPINGVRTYSSFYRAYKVPLLKQFFSVYNDHAIKEKRFACMVEMLIKLNRITKNISEVPMVLRGNMRRGKSKMKIIRTTIDYLFLISRLKIQFMMMVLRRNNKAVPEKKVTESQVMIADKKQVGEKVKPVLQKGVSVKGISGKTPGDNLLNSQSKKNMYSN
jgi:dolichol-phosphate mannosyltransferase